MSAFGSGSPRFTTSQLTGFGGKFQPNSRVLATTKGRKLSKAEELQVRQKLKAAAFTDKGVDWQKLFRYYDTDNSGAIGMIEFKRLLRGDAKISVSQLPDNSVRALYNSIDLDGSGEIDAQEFIAWVNYSSDDDQKVTDFEEQEREWGASVGYGRVSPRKLHSPSQRRYDKAKGWVVNNDENSFAEAAVLRREGSSLAAALDKSEEIVSPSSSKSRKRNKQRAKPDTIEGQLAKVRASFHSLKVDYAKQEKVLKEALITIETLQKEKLEAEKKIKDQRRTIAVMNRREK